MENYIKKFINKKSVYIVIMLIILLHPIIELDYLCYDWLNKFNLPRLTTIVDFIVLPLLIILTFCLFEKKKKKIFIFALIYGILFGVYFLLHCHNADFLQYNMHLPKRYVFLKNDEIIYVVTLLMPLVYIWVVYLMDFSEKALKFITVGLSSIVSLPIFISNLFVFGKSTYQGYTIANFFSWFALPYDKELHHPRLYATKFFFEEGNTIGILLIMILPFLYYFLYKSKTKKEKGLLAGLILIHSMAMIILSTRIATYGSALIPAAMLAIYLVLLAFKMEKLRPKYICYCLVMTMIAGTVIPFGPAYQNQQIDATNYGFVKQDDDKRAEARDEILRNEEGLEPFSEEWLNFYTYAFEQYAFLIGVTPPVYYLEWYDYRLDPKFWIDVIFDYELEERINGRQIENIFTHYKFDPLTPYQKAFGMGYSTFMRGSIILERDFAQQYFSFGPIGFIFLMVPWILVAAYLGIKLILGYNNGRWTYLNIVLMMSFCIGLLSSYISGHTLGEFTTSLFIALCAGMLARNLKVKHE